MSFFGGLFGGQNTSLNSDIGQSSSLASFLNSTGTSDTATASNFMKTLLSGNSSAVNQLLAPQISGITKRAQQEKQQVGEFGGRSGGTTGSMLALDDDTHAQINDMISKLTGSAASGLGSLGSSMIGQGETALNMNEQFSQQQMQNWQNSILGKGITGAVGAAETFGLGAAGGALPGGGGAFKSGEGALASFLNG